jgi:hypothetical protein
MNFAPIDHLADVDAVLEKMSERADTVRAATLGAAVRYGADFRYEPCRSSRMVDSRRGYLRADIEAAWRSYWHFG